METPPPYAPAAAAAIPERDIRNLRTLLSATSPRPWTVDQSLSPLDRELAVRAVNALPRLLDAAEALRAIVQPSR